MDNEQKDKPDYVIYLRITCDNCENGLVPAWNDLSPDPFPVNPCPVCDGSSYVEQPANLFDVLKQIKEGLNL